MPGRTSFGHAAPGVAVVEAVEVGQSCSSGPKYTVAAYMLKM